MAKKGNKSIIGLCICSAIVIALLIVGVLAVSYISNRNRDAAAVNAELTQSLDEANSKLNEASNAIASYEQQLSSANEKIAGDESTLSDLRQQLAEAQAKKKANSQAVPAGADQVLPPAVGTPEYQAASDADSPLSDNARAIFASANNYDGEKMCYLTFDDGPSDNTDGILDILQNEGVKATFFVVHNQPDRLKRMYNEGHAIGLHTASHKYSQIYASEQNFFSDLNAIGDIVENAVGYRPKIMRFPGGSSNTVSKKYCRKIMSALSKKVVEAGYLYYDWNASDGDADGSNIPVERLMQNIRNSGTSKQRVVVLMHDADDKCTTVEALPQIIAYYRDAGYAFSAITADTPMITHGINN